MLHVSLLGEQAIIDDATGSVRTRSSRTVALVAFLAAHTGAPQPRQRIAGQFWPDSTDAQALTNLRRELHHLRQALGDEQSLVVTSRDLHWQDTDTCRVDMRTFDIERKAALAAEAAGDSDGILAHASAGDRSSTGATCCLAGTTTGCWKPGQSLNASASACVTCYARRGRERVI